MVSRSMMVAALVALIMAVLAPSASAFAPRAVASRPGSVTTATSPNVVFMAKAKGKQDLSDIETRDMTREEMIRFNQLTEDKMNEELGMMTAFSAIISLPILYLFWVALFSD
jgi:hypothetical protein